MTASTAAINFLYRVASASVSGFHSRHAVQKTGLPVDGAVTQRVFDICINH